MYICICTYIISLHMYDTLRSTTSRGPWPGAAMITIITITNNSNDYLYYSIVIVYVLLLLYTT